MAPPHNRPANRAPLVKPEKIRYTPLGKPEEGTVAGQSSIVPGTLEMLVLKTLSLEPMHGWGIGERIQQLSREVFAVNQGTLYPALERLQRDGLITAEWRTTENNRRGRYYRITRSGLKRLETEREEWERSARAVDLILRTT